MSVTKHIKEKYDIKYVTEWKVPEDMAAIIAMPNIPKPLHGVAPRTLLGAATWNRMRRACYAAADMTCEICGKKLDKGMADAHEVYDIDYEKGVAVFKRTVCACRLCHRYGIHSGRCITLYKNGNPLMPKDSLLSGAENVFALISYYNSSHKGEPLRCYATMLDYLKCDDLREEMEGLIEKYHMEFYEEDEKKMAKWGDWKLIIGDQEYPTPYKNEKDWKKAMEEAGAKDTARIMQKNLEEKFSGGVYDELKAMLNPVENSSKNTVDITDNV